MKSWLVDSPIMQRKGVPKWLNVVLNPLQEELFAVDFPLFPRTMRSYLADVEEPENRSEFALDRVVLVADKLGVAETNAERLNHHVPAENDLRERREKGRTFRNREESENALRERITRGPRARVDAPPRASVYRASVSHT